jgi:hypothetical protein
MFSFRDLKAISLLDRLNKSRDTAEEEALLGALHETPSKLAIRGLLDRAKSPRLAVRIEALHALEALKTLNEDAEKALIADTINNPYTTAYISARILGNHHFSSAIFLLRELAVSDDYMLAGEAIIALARLEDHAFLPQVERIIVKTKNPRLKIMGVEAFGIYRSPNSLSILLDMLRVADPPPYLRDEVVLSMASILDTQNQFYKLLIRFLEDESLTATLAMDEVESATENYSSAMGGWKNIRKKPALAESAKQARALSPAVSAFAGELKGNLLSRWLMELPDDLGNPMVRMILSEVVLDDELVSHNRLRLLISHWAAWLLRIWTNRLKQ